MHRRNLETEIASVPSFVQRQKGCDFFEQAVHYMFYHGIKCIILCVCTLHVLPLYQASLSCVFQVITIICIAVWAINIGHFNDPAHGGSWMKVSAADHMYS